MRSSGWKNECMNEHTFFERKVGEMRWQWCWLMVLMLYFYSILLLWKLSEQREQFTTTAAVKHFLSTQLLSLLYSLSLTVCLTNCFHVCLVYRERRNLCTILFYAMLLMFTFTLILITSTNNITTKQVNRQIISSRIHDGLLVWWWHGGRRRRVREKFMREK